MTHQQKNQTQTARQTLTKQPTLPTFMDHVRELQGRLFWIAITFLAIGGASYPFFEVIARLLLEPLKGEQQLVYLTPGGAFSFIIKVCAYVGFIGTLPVIIFHIYRFVMPAVRKVQLRTVLKYTVISMLLAACGVAFAYTVSLPAALYFLTSFNLDYINPMITVDSYMSFIMTYLVAAAVLFQLPLLMIIANSANKLKPKKLMQYQRHMILASFVIAAIISPTPDAMNQTLLASPVVAMYQVGILAVWITNRRDGSQQLRVHRKVKSSGTSTPRYEPKIPPTLVVVPKPAYSSSQLSKDLTSSVPRSINKKVTIPVSSSIDGFRIKNSPITGRLSPSPRVIPRVERPSQVLFADRHRPLKRPRLTIDGVSSVRPRAMVGS